MPLVEVVPSSSTGAEKIQLTLDFYRELGKSPVLVMKEVPGFAANRLQAALCNEAYSLVKNGVLSAEDVGKSQASLNLRRICAEVCLLISWPDACVTSSLGPRWALTGPFVSNVFGGGGGKDGFRRMMQHLGPASKFVKFGKAEHCNH
jgi:3-hydroxyacyl-CoA dehydrogenase